MTFELADEETEALPKELDDIVDSDRSILCSHSHAERRAKPARVQSAAFRFSAHDFAHSQQWLAWF
jgi:hypothetical protein